MMEGVTETFQQITFCMRILISLHPFTCFNRYNHKESFPFFKSIKGLRPLPPKQEAQPKPSNAQTSLHLFPRFNTTSANQAVFQALLNQPRSIFVFGQVQYRLQALLKQISGQFVLMSHTLPQALYANLDYLFRLRVQLFEEYEDYN